MYIHSILAGDIHNSIGDGEVYLQGALLQFLLCLRPLGLTPHPAPLIWGTHDNVGLLNPAQSLERKCIPDPQGAAQMGGGGGGGGGG